MVNQPTVLIIPHTHWDRAWYVPFQVFRRKLLRLLDRAIDLLEQQPELRFVGDGQTAMIADYLELRPEQRPRIEQLVADGKLKVGPWFILPDEFLVSGESIVRNIQIGMRDAESLGGVMHAGLMPDSFGHVGQMPQVMLGFGIDSFIFSRGLHFGEPPAEFHWQGHDGSRLLALFQIGGYYGGATLGYPGGCDTEWVEFRLDHALERLEGHMADHHKRGKSGVTLIHNGMDHLELQGELPEVLAAARKKWPKSTFRISDYEEAVETVKRKLARKRLQTIKGELTYPHGNLLKGVYSSRVRLKQANQHTEFLLTMLAEPLEAVAKTVKPDRGDELPLIEYAWRELLKNQPHDDICGCSTDLTHRENVARSEQIDELLDHLWREALRDIAHAIDWSHVEGTPLVVFNSAPVRRRDAVRVTWDMKPEDWQELGGRVALFDADGNPLEVSIRSAEKVVWNEVRNTYRTVRVTADIAGLDLAPWSFTTLSLRKAPRRSAKPEGVTATRNGLENEHLRVTITKDGRLNVLHKATGRTYRNLNALLDDGDRGDEYNWCPVEGDAKPIQPEAPKRAPKIHADATRGTIRWLYNLRVPDGLSADRKKRASRRITTPVEVEVSLRAGASMVDIRIEFENKTPDHRLRAHFPTGLESETVRAGSPYATVERPVDPTKQPRYREDMASTLYTTENMQGHVSVADAEGGLAILAKGLYEYEAISSKRGVELALTLLRCTGWLSRKDLSTRPGDTGPPLAAPEGQDLGPHVFEYAIRPFASDEALEVPGDALAFALPVVAETGNFDASPQWLQDDSWKKSVPPDGPLPPSFSIVRCDSPGVTFTALRRVGDNVFETRFYNETMKRRRTHIQFARPVSSLCRTDLGGESTQRLTPGSSVRLDLKPAEIVTLRFAL